MKQTILNMSKRTKSLVFGGAYAVHGKRVHRVLGGLRAS